MPDLRVVAYNILDGGIGRADPLAEVILAQKPDVVCLVEADDHEVRDRIAWRLGFDQIAATGRDGRTSVLMTRGTIATSVNVTGDDKPRSLLLAEVAIDGIELGVAVAHFTGRPSKERELVRQREADALLATCAAWRSAGLPHVLGGDFNSTSPGQRVDLDALPPKLRPHVEANGNTLPRDVIRAIVEAGYVDTMLGDDASHATTFTTQHPALRLDYVFAHGCEPVDCRVETDRLAKAASDHFPVVATVRVPGA
ncbi:MAG: endonuclease/exonuclease/phosphatase family protein [Planctomycetota bacterium]